MVREITFLLRPSILRGARPCKSEPAPGWAFPGPLSMEAHIWDHSVQNFFLCFNSVLINAMCLPRMHSQGWLTELSLRYDGRCSQSFSMGLFKYIFASHKVWILNKPIPKICSKLPHQPFSCDCVRCRNLIARMSISTLLHVLSIWLASTHLLSHWVFKEEMEVWISRSWWTVHATPSGWYHRLCYCVLAFTPIYNPMFICF